MAKPSILDIKRESGIAGQIAYRVKVTYDDESPSVVRFYGSLYGGPVVMESAAGQVFVRDPDRFGAFGPAWVRRFFGEE